jgi:hypothetical protein
MLASSTKLDAFIEEDARAGVINISRRRVLVLALFRRVIDKSEICVVLELREWRA